jgi:hypothetical protein
MNRSGNMKKFIELLQKINLKFMILKKSILLFVFFIAGLFVFNSCNDLPTELGYNLLEDTISVSLITSADTNLIVNTENYAQKLTIFNAGAVYIGNAGKLKANTFLRFGSIPDTLKNINLEDIISAEIIMFPYKYTFGDTNSNTLSFKTYEIKKTWTKDFSWDSLTGDFYDTKVLGDYNKQISYKDTIIPSISIPFDKEIVKKWFVLQSDTNTAKQNYGVAIVPNAESNVIRQFSAQQLGSANSSSSLKVVIKNKSNTTDTLFMPSAVEFSVINKPEFNNETILVQGGTGLRSKIYFDLSMLPELAAVHKSQLEMTFDWSGYLAGNIKPDTVIAFDLYSEKDSLLTTPIRTFYGSVNTTTGKMVCYSISSGVETWLRTTKKGYLVAKFEGLNSEYKRLDRYSFFSNKQTDKTKRPYLKLIYSKRLKSSPNVK